MAIIIRSLCNLIFRQSTDKVDSNYGTKTDRMCKVVETKVPFNYLLGKHVSP